MRKAEQVIFAVMTMVSDGQGNVLMQHRADPGWPGYAFPGGHVEQGESFADTAIREIREETGIRIAHPVLCGVKHYPLDSGRDTWCCCTAMKERFQTKCADRRRGTPCGCPNRRWPRCRWPMGSRKCISCLSGTM